MTRMERVEQVTMWLDKVEALPPGHPDRLRFLTYAEQLFEERPADRPAGDPVGGARAGNGDVALGGPKDAR